MRRLLAAALLALSLPRLALAEPAFVRVFEAVAREAPSREAPAVHTFVEGATVSVSEEVKDGWRRVRLPDGGSAWIEDAALGHPAAPAAAASPAPAPAPATVPPPPPVRPDLRPRIYVKDLDHLAGLMKADAKLGARADDLRSRVHTSRGVLIGGVVVSAGLEVYAATRKLENAPFLAGIGVLLGSMLLSNVISPGRDDVLDLVNDWNTAHPDAPFDLGDRHAEHAPAR